MGKNGQKLDLRCVLVPAPWRLGPKTRLESRINKVTPHCTCRPGQYFPTVSRSRGSMLPLREKTETSLRWSLLIRLASLPRWLCGMQRADAVHTMDRCHCGFTAPLGALRRGTLSGRWWGRCVAPRREEGWWLRGSQRRCCTCGPPSNRDLFRCVSGTNILHGLYHTIPGVYCHGRNIMRRTFGSSFMCSFICTG